MDIRKKIRLFTETDDGAPTLTGCIRSNAVNHLSPSICDNYMLAHTCRVDTSGNVAPIEVGNTVYNNISGSTKFNGNNLYYAVSYLIAAPGDNVYICQINTVGEITAISTTCVLPSEDL